MTAAATYAEMRSNHFWNTNMTLEKCFRLGEKYSVILSAQATNLFNNVQFSPGLNTSFGGTVLPATVAANPSLNLKVGQLQDSANTFGTFRRNTYDPRQIELVARFRF